MKNKTRRFELLTGLVLLLAVGLGLAWFYNVAGLSGQYVERKCVTQLAGALVAYQHEYGSWPTGSQAEIIAALRGDNPRHVVFIELDPRHLSKKGEFLDEWGTPYHIEIIPGEKPHVYSLGPDRQDEHGERKSDDIASWVYPA